MLLFYVYRLFSFPVVCCMTTKAEKPTLQGQRIKTRKRDEKAKYDPVGFRDAILQASIFKVDLKLLTIDINHFIKSL